MPILLQEVRRRPPLRRRRFLGVPPAYLACAAICSGVFAGWLVRPGFGPAPDRTATIIVMPRAPDESSAAAQARTARPVATADKTAAPQPQLDRAPVGSIPTPVAPAQAFSELERAAPQKYTGFRVVTPQQ